MYQNLKIKKKERNNYIIQSIGFCILLFVIFFSPNAIFTILGYALMGLLVWIILRNARSIRELSLDVKELNLIFFNKRKKKIFYQDLSYRFKQSEITIYSKSKKIAVIKKTEWDEFSMIYSTLKKYSKIQGETLKEKAGGLVKEIIKDEIKDPVYRADDY